MAYRSCPACNNLRKLTRHHVIPKRWRKGRTTQTGSTATVLICRDCHDEVEKEIYAREKRNKGQLTNREYWQIVHLYMRR